MKQVIARGRHMGKSTISDIQSIIMRQQSLEMAQSIDKMIIDDLWPPKQHSIRKSWRDRRGRLMHRISASDEVWDWLTTVHPQQGSNNPEWWKFQNQINITDKLYTLLLLKFAE